MAKDEEITFSIILQLVNHVDLRLVVVFSTTVEHKTQHHFSCDEYLISYDGNNLKEKDITHKHFKEKMLTDKYGIPFFGLE